MDCRISESQLRRWSEHEPDAVQSHIDVCARCRAAFAVISDSPSETRDRSKETTVRRARPSDVPPLIGQYEVLYELGRGGMGVVYLGRDTRLDRAVAIKTLPRFVSTDAEALARLEHEAKVLACLNHHNVASIYNLVEEAGDHYLILEFVGGETLRDRIIAGDLTVDETLALCAQIAAGMEAAHAQGIVHRDLKPSNVMIRADGQVRVLDFGIATAAGRWTGRASADGSADASTDGSSIVGTPQYMSPEQARGDAVDARADVWAFGCILFESLAGQRAFVAQRVVDAAARTPGDVPDWHRLPESLPPSLRDLLRSCLAVDVESRLADMSEVLAHLESALGGHATGGPRATTPNNLPSPVTSFVGRCDTLAELRSLLERSRLVTINGSGGCGKTRLVLEVAHERLRHADARDGIWFATFAALDDPTRLVDAVASVIGVTEKTGQTQRDAIIEQLRSRAVLLILDNCEHLLAACADLVTDLLQGCPDLRIIVTSREGLGISGEATLRVPSLTVPPDDDEPSTASVRACESGRLFADRARAARSTFELTDECAGAVAAICRRLDGIPLALELAAARVSALSVEQIAVRLDDSFRLLTGGSRTALPRQQTLRATIDWSYALLAPVERTLLERLSVFAGGWTLDAAERVCADPRGDASSAIVEADVMDLLATLVDKSLVVYERRETGPDRYRLLETVRQYAREKLNTSGAAAHVRHRHLDYAVWFAERAGTELNGPDQAVWLEQLEVEHENLLAALQWCDAAPDGATKGLELARRLYRFWMVRGHLAIGRAALAAALEREAKEPPSPGRARALNALGALARYHGDHAAARSSSESALALHRELDDQRGVAEALDNLGLVASDQGDYVRARALLEESLAIGRAIDDKTAIARAISNLGMLAWRRGELPFARACIEDALRVNRARGDRRRIARGLHSLAKIAREEGDITSARELQRQSLELHRGLGNKQGMGASLAELARLALAEGRLQEAADRLKRSLHLLHELGNTDWILRSIDVAGQIAAARHDDGPAAGMFGSVETIRKTARLPMSVGDRDTHDKVVARVRTHLGEPAFERAMSEGAGRSLEVAVANALAWLAESDQGGPAERASESL